jgi:hypothetical protein
MHQMIKAMTVAGMVATGLPSLTEVANAQSPNQWNIVRPQACETGEVFDSNGDSTKTWILIWNTPDTSSFYFSKSNTVSALAKLCYDGSAFWVYVDNIFRSTNVYITPGLK